MRLKINPLSNNLKTNQGKIQGPVTTKQGKLPRLDKRKPKHLEAAKKKAMIINKVKNRVILSMIAAGKCKTLRKLNRAILQDLI